MQNTEEMQRGMTKVDRYGWTVAGDNGQRVDINKHALKVDRTYQRDATSESKILTIAREWNPVAVGMIVVSKRPDGSLYIIDGQHRWLASLKRADVQELPCRVFVFESVKEEADAFLFLNQSRSNVSAYYKHRAGIVRGDSVSIEIQKMVDDSGRRVIGNGKGAYGVFCVAAISVCYKKNPEVCRKAYWLAHELCGSSILDAEIFKGLFAYEWFLQKTDCDESVFNASNKRKILDTGMKSVKHSIKVAKNDHGKGGDRVASVGIARILNHKRRNRLPIPS